MYTNFKKMAWDPGGANMDSPPLLCHIVQQIFVLVIIQITIIKKHGENKQFLSIKIKWIERYVALYKLLFTFATQATSR